MVFHTVNEDIVLEVRQDVGLGRFDYHENQTYIWTTFSGAFIKRIDQIQISDFIIEEVEGDFNDFGYDDINGLL